LSLYFFIDNHILARKIFWKSDMTLLFEKSFLENPSKKGGI